MENSAPENFRSSIVDFTTDLSTTFPEFAALWSKWKDVTTPESDFSQLYEHCSQVYPERFFDILNQNAEIFSENSDVNTSFLPGVDFKILYNCDGVSEKTRETIWKYLQVILLILVNTMKDKMDFGDAMKMFEDLDEGDLHSKLQDAMQNIGQFFEQAANSEQDTANGDSDSPSSQSNSTASGLPQMEEIHNHLQGLFDGKIGQLAKELAEDMSEDIAASFGDDMENMTSTKDVLSKLMQNPEKIKNVVNTVKDRLTSKMESGDISREDLMTEASEMMNKMNGGGEGGLSDMFKSMGGAGGMGDILKSMGGAGGMANMFKNMGGDRGNDDDDIDGGGMAEMFKNMAQGLNVPKGARLDTNAMNRAQERFTVKERLIARGKARQQEQLVKQLEKQAADIQRQKEYEEFMAKNPNIFDTNDPNSLVYRIEGETQEKSTARPDGEMSASKKKRLKKKARKEAQSAADKK